MASTNEREVPAQIGGASLLMLLSLSAVWFLLGWMVGGSRDPVVGAVLPLIFGLLGSVGLSWFETSRRVSGVMSSLKEVAPDAYKSVAESAGRFRKPGLGGLSAVGIILFCTAYFFGSHYGTDLRIERVDSLAYKPLHEVVALDELGADERALLYVMYWQIEARGISATRAEFAIAKLLGAAKASSTEAMTLADVLADFSDALAVPGTDVAAPPRPVAPVSQCGGGGGSCG